MYKFQSLNVLVLCTLCIHHPKHHNTECRLTPYQFYLFSAPFVFACHNCTAKNACGIWFPQVKATVAVTCDDFFLCLSSVCLFQFLIQLLTHVDISSECSSL